MIATSLNPLSEEDDIDGSDEENDEDMDGDDSNGEDNDDDNVMEDDDTLNAELNSKGYIERGIVLSAERCEGACEFDFEGSFGCACPIGPHFSSHLTNIVCGGAPYGRLSLCFFLVL